MLSHDDIKPTLKKLIDSDVVISPWLAGINGEPRFDPDIFEILDWNARDFVNLNWSTKDKVSVFGDLPVPRRFPHTAFYETAASTAVFIAQERQGVTEVTEEIAHEAIHIVEEFIIANRIDHFVKMYGVITGYDNFNALEFYESMPERDFLLGHWHRPWIDYSLDDELIVMCQVGTVEIRVHENERHLFLTQVGRDALQKIRVLLTETGFLKRRNQTYRISQFGKLNEYDMIMDELSPNLIDERKWFLDYSGIEPGMKVLELGCGTGTFTLSGGLIERIGRNGKLVSSDAAMGMVQRAKSKLSKADYSNIDLVQCRAEQLPFADNTFDAVIGMLFLHYTDIPGALKEIKRVTKPNGIVASYHAHAISGEKQIDFLVEWFRGYLTDSDLHQVFNTSVLPDPDWILQQFEEQFQSVECSYRTVLGSFANPDTTIRFLLEGSGIFQQQLERYPWKARYEVIDELRRRGHEITRKYTPGGMSVPYPAQIIRVKA